MCGIFAYCSFLKEKVSAPSALLLRIGEKKESLVVGMKRGYIRRPVTRLECHHLDDGGMQRAWASMVLRGGPHDAPDVPNAVQSCPDGFDRKVLAWKPIHLTCNVHAACLFPSLPAARGICDQDSATCHSGRSSIGRSSVEFILFPILIVLHLLLPVLGSMSSFWHMLTTQISGSQNNLRDPLQRFGTTGVSWL